MAYHYPVMRRLRRAFAGDVFEAEYEQASWGEWFLRRWRVTVRGERAGRWHKVHGNQQRDVAGWPLTKTDIIGGV